MEQEIIKTKKKKFYKRKLFYILVVVGLIVASIVYGQIKKATKKPSYETVKVERGILEQTVDATGNIESADELDLRFEMGGRIGKIYKPVGSEVKVGDIIIDLELGELNARVAQASASVAKAQANLDKLMAGQTDSYLVSIKAKVEQAKANRDQSRVSYDDLIANAEASLEKAKLNLELAEGGEASQIVGDAYDDLRSVLISAQSTMSSALTEADNILGIDNSLANDEFDDILSALNTSKLNTANNKYYSAKSTKNDADGMINSLSVISDSETYGWAADTTQEALYAMKDLMFAVVEVLDNTVAVGSLSQSELDTLKTGVQTDYGAVNTKYASLIDQMQAVESAKNSYTTNFIIYNNAVANLENLKKRRESDGDAYQSLVDQAQANYDDAHNPPRVEDVAGYQASLSEVRANLAQAVANRNKGRIIAPVDGMVGKIEGKVGEYVSAQDMLVKLVSPHFEVSVDIPETDIIKISGDDGAEITLDAFGEDVVFLGKVTEIEKGETIIQDVVYYSVTVSLEGDEEHEILNGMTANIIFDTEKKQDVLYIPQRTVRTNDDGSKYVRVLKNKEVEEVTVETGLRGDNGLVEIMSGLEEGQEVVLREIEE